jgi:hypothetical protein
MTLFIPAALFDHTVIGSHCGQICQYALRGPFAISNLVLITFNHPGMVTNLVILDHILLTAEHFDLSTKNFSLACCLFNQASSFCWSLISRFHTPPGVAWMCEPPFLWCEWSYWARGLITGFPAAFICNCIILNLIVEKILQNHFHLPFCHNLLLENYCKDLAHVDLTSHIISLDWQ